MVPIPERKPRVLVAHAWPGPRRGLAAYLTHLRADLCIEEIGPEELDGALEGEPGPIVLCDLPSPAVERLARGWIAVTFDGPLGAVAGVGASFRPMAGEDIEDILGAIDALIAGTWIGDHTHA